MISSLLDSECFLVLPTFVRLELMQSFLLLCENAVEFVYEKRQKNRVGVGLFDYKFVSPFSKINLEFKEPTPTIELLLYAL